MIQEDLHNLVLAHCCSNNQQSATIMERINRNALGQHSSLTASQCPGIGTRKDGKIFRSNTTKPPESIGTTNNL